MKIIRIFYFLSKKISFLLVKFSVYLNKLNFVMSNRRELAPTENKFFSLRVKSFSEKTCCAEKQRGCHKSCMDDVWCLVKMAENLPCVSSYLKTDTRDDLNTYLLWKPLIMFVCVEVLRPSQPDAIVSSVVRLLNLATQLLGRLSPISG